MADINLGPVFNPKAVTEAIQVIADNISEDNIIFLSDLAKKPGINKKIKANKFMIKNLL